MAPGSMRNRYAGGGLWLDGDERTGETYRKLSAPPTEVLNQALQAFGALLQSLQK